MREWPWIGEERAAARELEDEDVIRKVRVR